MLVGAGTVRSAEAVRRVADAGGKLIVTPHADVTVTAAAKASGLLAVPGFLTPTEAFSLIDAGADALKLFPAEAASPAVLGALRAVLPPDTAVLPVGGIGPANLASWRRAGAAGFGCGSSIYKPGDTAAEVRVKAEALIAALADADGLVPNDETIEAMKAARRGELVTSESPANLLNKLNADD
jgi:2-dehydro-3-deoxyphosphogalactonate aldolase